MDRSFQDDNSLDDYMAWFTVQSLKHSLLDSKMNEEAKLQTEKDHVNCAASIIIGVKYIILYKSCIFYKVLIEQ
jgi:hypothetical protein